MPCSTNSLHCEQQIVYLLESLKEGFPMDTDHRSATLSDLSREAECREVEGIVHMLCGRFPLGQESAVSLDRKVDVSKNPYSPYH